MNLVNNGPGNGLLSDAAKPLPDPNVDFSSICSFVTHLDTSYDIHQCHIAYIDDDDKLECVIFKMSPGLNELTNLSGKALYGQILLTLTEGNFIESTMDISIWNLDM